MAVCLGLARVKVFNCPLFLIVLCSREADISIACNVTIEFSKGVHSTDKRGTIRDSHHGISEPSGCKNPASGILGKRRRACRTPLQSWFKNFYSFKSFVLEKSASNLLC